MNIGFTGHRPERIKDYQSLYNDLSKVLYGLVYLSSGKVDESVRFILGGAPGFDTMVASILTGWNIHPEQIDIIIPFRGFEKYATKDESALKRAISINNTLLSDRVIALNNPGNFALQCNLRNEEIIKRSNYLISYWDGIKKGGTWNTICMAQRKRIVVQNLFEGVEIGEKTVQRAE